MNNNLLVNGISVLLMRVFLSGIFISAGLTHLLHPDKITGRIQSASFNNLMPFMGDPYWLGIVSGYVLLIGGIGLLLGIFTRWAAVILFFVLIPITITIQFGNGIMHGPLWKNVALFGALIFFIVNNPKIHSIYNK